VGSEEEIMKQAREERNRYNREWRRAHPESVKATNAKYWAKRAAARKAAKSQEADDGGEDTEH